MLYEWVIFLAILLGLMVGQFLTALLYEDRTRAQAAHVASAGYKIALVDTARGTPCCASD